MSEVTLVLGLGNTIMADDGVGPKVVALLLEQGGLPDGDPQVRRPLCSLAGRG